MGAVTSLWLTGTTIVSARSHHRAMCSFDMAGTAGMKGHRDGEGTVSRFYYPRGVAVDGDGNVIVADSFNCRIRKITPQGDVSTLAGTGEQGYRDGEGTVCSIILSQ